MSRDLEPVAVMDKKSETRRSTGSFLELIANTRGDAEIDNAMNTGQRSEDSRRYAYGHTSRDTLETLIYGHRSGRGLLM